MSMILLILLVSGLFDGCKGCGKTEDKSDIPSEVQAQIEMKATGPVALVNGVEISQDAFNAEIEKITMGGARNLPEERIKKIKENILKRLIEEELLRQEVKRQGIEVTDQEVEEEFQKYKSRFRSEQQFQDYLTHGKTTVEEIKNRLRYNVSLNKLFTKLGKLEVTEEDIKKAYESGIKVYTEPEQIHVQHILFSLSENAPQNQVEAAKKRAEEALKAIKKGTDFAEIAKKYSDDATTKEKGGDLGWVRRGVMVPKFEEAAFALKPQEVTKEPVRTHYGLHIIKVLEKKEERVKPLEEVREQIVESLKNRNQYKARLEVIEKLRSEAKIETLMQL